MNRSASRLAPVLAVLAACTADPNVTDGSTSQTTGDSGTTGTEGDSGDESTGDTGTPSCSEEACAGSSEDYCFPCSPESSDPEPWLELGGSSGFAEGGSMKVVCGGQGSWMFEIRPTFGGFTLDGPTVHIAYEVHVDDFNIVAGAFAKGTKDVPVLCCDTTEPYDYEGGLYGCNSGYVGMCYSYFGGLRVIRFFPPDTIPELTDLDGKAVQIDLTMSAGDKGPQEFHLEGTVSSTQPWEDCTYYDALPPPAADEDESEDPFDWSSEHGIPT